MKLNSQEMAVLEQALSVAINNGYDYRSVLAYRELLSKLQTVPVDAAGLTLETDRPVMAGHAAEAGGGPMAGSVLSVGESPAAGPGSNSLRYDAEGGEDLL